MSGVIGGQNPDGTDTFVNQDNLIEGTGTIGRSGFVYPVTFRNENAGRVLANGPFALTIGGNTVNNGQMIANGGTLRLISPVDQSGGGTMTASGTRSKILFDGGSLTGGILAATDGATIEVDANATFSNAMTINGNVAVTTGATLKLVGDIYLNGTIDGTGGHLDLSGAHLHGGTVTGGSGLTLVSSDGFFDGAGATVGNAAPIDIGPGRTLTVKGALSNSGIIKVDGSSGYGAATLLVSDVVALTGGGSIVMLDSYGSNLSGTAAIIKGTIASEKLDNVDNTIQGYGVLGAGTLTFVNEAGGIVKATASTLTLDTGATALSNLGLFAAQGGTLVIASALTNGGSIYSGTGGTVTLKAAVTNTGNVQIAGGTLALSGGSLIGTGSLEVATKLETVTTGTIEGTSQTVHLFGDVVVDQGATLTLEGAIQNEGNAKLNASSVYGGATLLLAGKVTLSGRGIVTLLDTYGSNQSATAAVVRGTSATDILENAGNTIQGYGQLGAGTLTLINKAIGTIVATSSTLTVDTGAAVIANYGLLEAVGGTLAVNSAVANAGVILAGAGGHVVLHGAVTGAGSVKAVQGGTLVLAGGTIASTVAVSSAVDTTIEVASAAGLDGSQFAVSQAGTLGIDQGASLALAGTVANTGAMVLNGSSGYGAAALTVSGAVKLTGGGTLTLLDTYGSNQSATAAVVAGSSSSDSLENVDNTIRGYGQLGAGKLTLANDAFGTINATDSTLVLRTSSMRNAGLLEAGGGTLVIETTIDNTGGQIVAAGSTVQLGGEGVAAMISGGVLSRSGTGNFVVTAAATLKDLTSSGPILVNSAATLTLAGVIVDQEGIALNGSSGYGASTLRVSGPVSLSGGGTITLTDTYSSNRSPTVAAITGTTTADVLDNVDNTITGYGDLGQGKLSFTNEAAGTVSATAATLNLNFGATTTANRGTFLAAGGTLAVGSKVSNLGIVRATAGTAAFAAGTVANLVSGVLTGGTWSTKGGTITLADAVTSVAATLVEDGATGGITVAGTSLDSSLASITAAGALQLLGGRNWAGTNLLANAGEIRLAGGRFASGTLTNTGLIDGSGTIVSSVVNTGTIEAAGGALTLVAKAGGALQVDAGAMLVLQGGAGPGTTVTFAGVGGTLSIAPAAGASSFDLTLAGPGIGNTVDLAGVLASATSNPGSITLSAGGQVLGIIRMAAGTAYTADATPDGHGGTLIATRLSDPLFDPVYYLAHNPDIAAAGADPYSHYMNQGWKEGRNPSALFNTRFYLTQNPDVAASGVNPLTQFETVGWTQGRDPSIGFSVAKYLAAYPDIKAAGVDPLVHYVNSGKAEGRTAFAATPHAVGPQDPLIDAAYVYAGHPEVAAAGLDPTVWFNTVGWTLGANPDAFFNTTYYLNQNADVKAAGINPLAHFEASGWKEGRDPSALFSDRKYLAAYPDIGAARINPLQHYLSSGLAEGRTAFAATPHALGPQDPLVDATYVYAAHPEIAAAGLDATAWYHGTGWKVGANPDASFDTSYYLTQNPDVRAAGLDPLAHFEANGWKEGREPSLVFSDARYLAAYPDIKAAGVDPLAHYLASGRLEGRMAFLAGGATVAPDPLVNAAYFDAQLGATLIPTGAAGAQQAAFLYDAIGWQRGLNPDAFFDTNYYLSRNPDIAAAHINPLLHYENNGWKEGRDPSAQFSTNKYLAAYGDVKAAGLDPLLHFVSNGQSEGRSAFTV